MKTTHDYDVIRSRAAVYAAGASVTAITGEARHELLAFLLAKRTDYTQPGSIVESLVLREDASVAGQVLALIEDERVLLISDAPLDLDLPGIALNRGFTGVHISDRSETTAVVAVEGPYAWKVVQGIVHEDIAGVLLGESCSATLTSTAAVVVRTGRTGEYGYLIVAEGAERETLLEEVGALAHTVGGKIVGLSAVKRAQAEVNHPLFPEQFAGLSVREAGALWLLSPEREDCYLGSSTVRLESPERSLVAVSCSETDVPASGTPVLAGEHVVGYLHMALPRCEQANGFGLALLDLPFNVPGLSLQAGGSELVTVARPAVHPLSWTLPIG